MLTKLLISARLVLSTPAMAQEPDMQGVVDTAIPLCIENALQYNRGNKTWLRDHMDRAGTSPEVRRWLSGVCIAYFKGVMAGMKATPKS
jgi:hypothetical protein